ncbi:MAG: hypothetical protein AAGA12_02850 [Pseudomonadota bacterium]
MGDRGSRPSSDFCKAVLAVCTTTALAGPVFAQSIDGLYQPSGTDWSCSPNQIGMEGGALAIQYGVFEGVENRCELTNPQPYGRGTSFTAVCSAEGSTHQEQMTITPTANGVSIQRDSFTSYWRRCQGHQVATSPPQPTNSRWTFGGRQGVFESATRDANGNAVTFTCNDLGENGGLFVELGGRPISGGPLVFDVDGVEFGMTAWASDGRINTECSICGGNYMALWEATAAGNLMTVTASDGRSASFSLRGSRDALGDVACRPDEGF